jgi:hypothetical protein
MTINVDSQNFESYVPVYSAVPDKWEDARPFIVEQLKKIATGVNTREIGFYLDQELLTGKAFIPGSNDVLDGGSSQVYRSILRKVVPFGGISVAGNPNTMAHEIMVDSNFTLIQLWASATDSSTFRSVTFSNPDTIYMDATNIYITSDNTYDRCNAIVEYIQEV